MGNYSTLLVLFIPEALRSKLPLKQYHRLRIDGEMHNMPIEAALQPAKGRSYLLISQAFMTEHQLNLGDKVVVQFNHIGDQDFIDAPSELQQTLNENESARAKWESLTTGKKRGYAAQISSANRQPKRIARVPKMIGFMIEDKNAGGRPFKC